MRVADYRLPCLLWHCAIMMTPWLRICRYAREEKRSSISTFFTNAIICAAMICAFGCINGTLRIQIGISASRAFWLPGVHTG
jgi:hypothetical protein